MTTTAWRTAGHTPYRPGPGQMLLPLDFPEPALFAPAEKVDGDAVPPATLALLSPEPTAKRHLHRATSQVVDVTASPEREIPPGTVASPSKVKVAVAPRESWLGEAPDDWMAPDLASHAHQAPRRSAAYEALNDAGKAWVDAVLDDAPPLTDVQVHVLRTLLAA